MEILEHTVVLQKHSYLPYSLWDEFVKMTPQTFITENNKECPQRQTKKIVSNKEAE